MQKRTWRQWLNRSWKTLTGGRKENTRAPHSRRGIPILEELETRLTPAVIIGPPSKLAFTVSVLPDATAGKTFDVKVNVEDINGNVVTTDGGTNVTMAVDSGPESAF